MKLNKLFHTIIWGLMALTICISYAGMIFSVNSGSSEVKNDSDTDGKKVTIMGLGLVEL